MNKEEFIKEVEKLDIKLTEDKLALLEKFYLLLIEWNKKINLTGITKKEEVYLKHFYDSLTLVKEIDFTKDINLCDVGSGAGFPGIVLKIVFPHIKITLIDSLNKRIKYLEEVIKELKLKDIEAIHTRMEDYSKVNTEKFDYITARAVSNLTMITEISIRSLKIDGKLVFMKGICDEEIEQIKPKLKNYGLELEKENKFILPIEESSRTLIVLRKISKTDNKYPRKIEQIKREISN